MPDFTQSPENLDPPTVVDHVLLPVADLEEGARSLRERHGLQSIAGGRHPKVGTANMIVPLGRQYLELIAVADPQEAAASRLGRRVTRALAEGRTFVDWATRTGSMDAMRGKLLAAGWDLPPVGEGSRRRPDGQVLRWRTQDVDAGADPTALPFVIEWDVPDGLHPGQAVASHPSGAKRCAAWSLARATPSTFASSSSCCWEIPICMRSARPPWTALRRWYSILPVGTWSSVSSPGKRPT